MRPYLALLLPCLIAAQPAQGARPFVTDDARIVDKDGCQIETFVKDQRRFDEKDSGSCLPAIPGARSSLWLHPC
jgi:hypothetical protein